MRHLLLTLIVILLASVVIIASTVRGQDSFTEAGDNTALPSHNADVGGVGAWVEAVDSAGTIIIFAIASTDYAAPTGGTNTAHVIHTMTPATSFSSADYDVSVKLRVVSTGQVDKDPIFLFGRWTDTSNHYVLGIDGDSGAGRGWALLKVVSGTPSIIESASTLTLATNDVIKLSMRGDTLKFYVNSTLIHCEVDASLSSTGIGGLGQGNYLGSTWGSTTADVNAFWASDDFTMTDFTGEGGDDNCAAGGGAPRGLLMGISG